jgi:hypothetical protein
MFPPGCGWKPAVLLTCVAACFGTRAWGDLAADLPRRVREANSRHQPLTASDQRSHPNFRMSVTNRFLAEVTTQPVTSTDPLTDCILGTTVRGTSLTTGQIQVRPVPAEQGMRLRVSLDGQAETWGHGCHGPVRARLVGCAAISASGELGFGPEGFCLHATDAEVSATGRPTQLWTVCRSRAVDRLITRAAWRRAARTQELADYIASRHAEQQLREQLGDELGTRLAELQRDYRERFREPLLRRAAFPRIFTARSDESSAEIALLLGADWQAGSPIEPPAVAGEAAVVVQLHETACDNLAALFLAGETLSEQQIRQTLERWLGQPDSGGAIEAREMLHITFAEERPITLRIEDNKLSLRLRTSGFTANRRAYQPMNVLLQYELRADMGRLVATRVGEPEITPPRWETERAGRLGAREIASRRLIRNMLERELQAEYVIETFRLPRPLDVCGPMCITQLAAAGGWLSIAADAAGAAAP